MPSKPPPPPGRRQSQRELERIRRSSTPPQASVANSNSQDRNLLVVAGLLFVILLLLLLVLFLGISVATSNLSGSEDADNSSSKSEDAEQQQSSENQGDTEEGSKSKDDDSDSGDSDGGDSGGGDSGGGDSGGGDSGGGDSGGGDSGGGDSGGGDSGGGDSGGGDSGGGDSGGGDSGGGGSGGNSGGRNGSEKNDSGGSNSRKGEELGEKETFRPGKAFGVAAEGKRIVYVVESSREMWGQPFATARDGVVKSLRTLDSQQKFTVMHFALDCYQMYFPRPVKELVTPDARARDRVESWLKKNQEATAGDPDFGNALSRALAFEPSTVFLLTRGGISEQQIREITRTNDNEAKIHVIGVSLSGSTKPLERLAKQNGGVFREID